MRKGDDGDKGDGHLFREKGDRPLYHPGISFLDSTAMWDGKRPFGLETPTCLHQALGNPQNKIPAIHVAGTNGKGSVCAMLSAIIAADDIKVGQLASPHLTHVTERCLINGQPVTADSFDESLSLVQKAAELGELAPSFFEIACAATFLEFLKQKIEWMVVEVGLGGRFDATNTIKQAKAAVITTVGFDHMHLLGDTLEKIAFEKAGIIHRAVPAFVGLVSPAVREVIQQRADECETSVCFINEEDVNQARSFSIALPGEHQVHNAALALKVARSLGFSERAIKEGLSSVFWPGRLEKVSTVQGDYLIDAAHNIDGFRALFSYLKDESGKYSSLSFVMAMLERKDWRQVLGSLREFSNESSIPLEVVFTRAKSQASVPPEDLVEAFGAGEAFERPFEALERSREKAGSEGLVVICGSLYLLAELRGQVVP